MSADTTMQVTPAPISMKHLGQLARQYASGTIGDEFRQSLPFPTVRDGRLTVGYFFMPAINRPRTDALIFPPCRRVWVQRDGGFVQLESIAPADLGLRDAVDEQVASLTMPEGMSAAEYVAAHTKLLDLFDGALTVYAKAPRSFPAGLDASVLNELRDGIAVFGEPGLERYYRAQSPDFYGPLLDER